MGHHNRGRIFNIVASAAAGTCECWTHAADFEVTATFPHDPTAYTQGFLTIGEKVFESTGEYGRSDVRRVDLQTGAVLARRALPASHFGEGLALFAGRLYQLTWKEGIVYVYEPDSLAHVDSIYVPGERWGLAAVGQHLFLSDGSDSLRVVNAETFATEHIVHVRYQGSPLRQLNELEYFRGAILANIYRTNWVAVIDPKTGDVTRMLDFTDLYPIRTPGAGVMNGIAVAPGGKELLLTGKFWPSVFRVRVHESVDLL